jgi:cell division protein FtsX
MGGFRVSRHGWSEVRRQLGESGPAGIVAVLLVAVATGWGGVVWTLRSWVTDELLSKQRGTTVVAVVKVGATTTELESSFRSQFEKVPLTAQTPRNVQEQLAGWFPELASVLLTLDPTSFPRLLQVEVAPDTEAAVAGWMRSRPEVELVASSLAWQARLAQTVSRFLIAGLALALALLIGCAVVVLLVVRLLVLAHADEIAIMRLIGAHEGEIRRPYLICGGVLGSAGGLLGGLMLLAAAVALRSALPSLGVPNVTILLLPIAGAVAGALGSGLGLASLPSEP